MYLVVYIVSLLNNDKRIINLSFKCSERVLVVVKKKSICIICRPKVSCIRQITNSEEGGARASISCFFIASAVFYLVAFAGTADVFCYLKLKLH